MLRISYEMFLIKTGKVENKIPDIIGLASTAILNTIIREVENKNPDVNGVVKMQIMTLKYQTWKENISLLLIIINLFTSDILEAKIQQKELVSKSNIRNLVKKS